MGCAGRVAASTPARLCVFAVSRVYRRFWPALYWATLVGYTKADALQVVGFHGS